MRQRCEVLRVLLHEDGLHRLVASGVGHLLVSAVRMAW